MHQRPREKTIRFIAPNFGTNARHCQKCGGKGGILSTRQDERRRKCMRCGHRWSTKEILYEPIQEEKENGKG